MNEIKEIMNGNIKIFNMRIEGETIGFDTPYNSNWNFMPRDFEQIIDTLQQENARLKDKLKDIEKILDADCCVENIYQAMCQYLNIHDFELDLEDYLKENQAIIKNIKINDKIII